MKVLLIVHDRNLGKNFFPMGMAYLAAFAQQAGHEVKIYCQDVYHYTEKELFDYLCDNHFDVVGVGFLAAYFSKVLKIAEAINALPNRPFFVLGGHGPSAIPEYMLRKTKADAVVMGEGELVLVDLLDALANGREISFVPGLGFRKGNDVFINQRRELISDLDTLPFPAWDLFPMEHYIASPWPPAGGTDRWMSLYASRGCLYRCNFCYRMDPGHRMRSLGNVLEEIKIMIDLYKINFFDFYDELFAPSKRRMIEFCEAISSLNRPISFGCNGRFNLLDRETLKIMKEAGCRFINFGLESGEQAVLDKMNKKITTEQIIEVTRLCKEMGIYAGLNVIWGNIGDTPESLKKTLAVLMEAETFFMCRTFRPPTPYPGSDLYYHALERGLLKDEEDFFNKHVAYDRMTVNFTDLPDDVFYKMLYEVNEVLIQAYFNTQAEQLLLGLRNLYFDDEYSFRLISYQQRH